MPKYALVVCGQPRTFEFCFPSLKRNIIDVYDPDIFICTDSNEQRIKELYKPVLINVTDQEAIFDYAYFKRNGIPSVLAVNDLSIAWKVNKAMQMKSLTEKSQGFIYDTVILTRFDVKFKSVSHIEAKENTLHVPLIGAYWDTPQAEPGIHWGGYSAHLCWSTSKIMDELSNIYFDKKDYLTLASNAGVPFGWAPEHVLKYFCDVNNINVQFENIEMMLIRGTNSNPLSYHNHKIAEFKDYA